MEGKWLKTLDRYIIRKFLGTFFFAISYIIVIVIIFDISERIDDFLEKSVPLKDIIFDYYLNFIPYFINLFSSLITFIAVIFFTSKMSSRTEVVPILGSGISYNRFLRPYLISAMVLALVNFSLANFIIPYTNVRLVNFENTYLKNPNKGSEVDIHMQVSPGEFIYMESYDKLEDVGFKFTLEKIGEQGLTYKLSGDEIRWNPVNKQWHITKYFTRTIQGMKETLSFGKGLDTTLNFTPSDFKVTIANAKTLKFTQLRKFIEKEKMRGAENVLEFEVEKHKRIAFPFATIVLTFIGVPLSSKKVRGGIGMHLGAGLGICFSYILIMQISTTFAIYSNLSAWVAVWIPNVVFSLIGLFLLKRAPK